MSSEKIFNALGKLSDDLISEAEIIPSARKNTTFRFRWKPLAAACLAVIMLALPVSAEMINGYVSNLLAPLYGGAQTELVDKIGVPIGAETIVGDYKLTADAIVGDKYNFAIVYSLTRTDGQPLEEGLCFENYHNSYRYGSGGGVLSHTLSDDGMTLMIVDQWTSRNMFLNRNTKVSFDNLRKYSESDQEYYPVQEGCWELQFVVRYEDTSKEIAINPITVTDESGDQYTINNIIISPVGIHFDMTAPNNYSTEEVLPPPYADFTLSVVLTDDTVITIEDRNMGSHGNLDDKILKADYGAMFDVPIPLETIKALIICDTELPITIN